MEEEKVYLVFDKVTPQLRTFVSALLIIAAFAFQISTKNILAGLPFIIACVILNLIKWVSVKRVHPSKLSWQEVTPTKIDQVLEHCQKVKKFRSKGLGCIFAFIFVIFFLVVFVLPIFEAVNAPFNLKALIVNLIILFVGLALSGQKNAWMPAGLDLKASIIRDMINSEIIKKDPSLQAMPYLEIGTTDKGSVPNDARFLIKFKDAPSEFIGIQGQISLNNVKGQAYPYFYVVLLAKHEFNLLEKFGEPTIENLVIEPKRTEEVDVIVVRQFTTKTSGYHTDETTQNIILINGIESVKRLF